MERLETSKLRKFDFANQFRNKSEHLFIFLQFSACMQIVDGRG